ncbi:MAG TPA: nitrite reductase small subunit NirD [Vicinamibacterales bacterium]|jgi:nitrite reductase (NADH) small subunit
MTKLDRSTSQRSDTLRDIPLAACKDIPRREGRAIRIGERAIAIFNLGDRFVAVDDRCPHRGGPLSDGIISGATIVCPLHAWKICLESGAVNTPGHLRACIRTYPTRIERDTVVIKWPGDHDVEAEDSSEATV